MTGSVPVAWCVALLIAGTAVAHITETRFVIAILHG